MSRFTAIHQTDWPNVNALSEDGCMHLSATWQINKRDHEYPIMFHLLQ